MIKFTTHAPLRCCKNGRSYVYWLKRELEDTTRKLILSGGKSRWSSVGKLNYQRLTDELPKGMSHHIFACWELVSNGHPRCTIAISDWRPTKKSFGNQSELPTEYPLAIRRSCVFDVDKLPTKCQHVCCLDTRRTYLWKTQTVMWWCAQCSDKYCIGNPLLILFLL